MRAGGVFAGLVLLGVMATPGTAQSLEDRIQEDGTTAFHFPVRDDVRVCEHSIRYGDGEQGRWYGSWEDRDRERCERGRLEVRVTMRAGVIRDLDLGMVGEEESDVDLGRVGAQEAADYLVEMPWRAVRNEEEAVGQSYFALGLGEDVDVSDRIAAAVVDRSLHSDARKPVLFWAGQMIGERIAEDLQGIVLDEAEDQDVRDHAIFALSRREAAESVPLLMELAREAPHLDSRKTALFWLARHDTDEVGDFFADLILNGGR